VAKVGTSKAGGTISQQAAVHPWLAADAHGNKQTNKQGQTIYWRISPFLASTGQRLFEIRSTFETSNFNHLVL
jgi:hypothetical protein